LIELTAPSSTCALPAGKRPRVLSKSDIVDNVWTYEFDGDPNIVETYISYLRKKVDSFDPP